MDRFIDSVIVTCLTILTLGLGLKEEMIITNFIESTEPVSKTVQDFTRIYPNFSLIRMTSNIEEN